MCGFASSRSSHHKAEFMGRFRASYFQKDLFGASEVPVGALRVSCLSRDDSYKLIDSLSSPA